MKMNEQELRKEIQELQKKISELEGKLNKTRHIGELKENYFIPDYQRGYKWTEADVELLWNDLLSFIDRCEKEKKDEEYCLQPLIIKHIKDDSYEVVDGQQRLTTTYLMLKLLSEQPQFSLTYQTSSRSEDKEMLEGIDSISDNPKTLNGYYISKAKNKIIELKKDLEKKGYPTLSTFVDTLKNKVFFIYYEIGEEDTKQMFTRVNKGKIPLTNAELIKALLLSEENLAKLYNLEDIKNEQHKMSSKWNEMEHELEDDSFWCFLCEPDKYKTRIELLFDLCAEEYVKDKKVRQIPKQERRTFLIYSELLKKYEESRNKTLSIGSLWKDIEDKFNLLKSYYKDNTYYHILGYLFAVYDVSEVLKIISQKDKTKTEIDLELQNLIREITLKENNSNKNSKEHVIGIKREIKKIENGKSEEKIIELDFSQISYSDNKNQIKNILLLHNIISNINAKEKARFPFDVYKKQGWDIEHIHAINDKDDNPDDTIKNLCLLSATINRDYKDKKFWDKSLKIREYVNNGEFVPICTQRVFLKDYYQEDNRQINNGNIDEKYVNGTARLLSLIGREVEKINEKDSQGIKDRKAFIEGEIEKFTKWNDNDKINYENDIERSLINFFNNKLRGDLWISMNF